MLLEPASSFTTGDAPTLAFGKICERLPDSTESLTRTPLPAIPKRFGGYEVKGELGRGGMGVVYEGYDPVLRRSVALKVLIDGHATNSQLQQRLRTEAEAVAQLQHPHIVQVHEIGWHDGAPFLALELLSGGSLAQVAGGKPLACRVAAQYLRDLAGAVAHAHEHGVVHRDLKPGNVLFTADGSPKITDFGIARLKDSDTATQSGLTQVGQVIGTPQYMAPEQATGDPTAVGPAADIYALGSILYELLTGQPPFHDADTGRVLVALKNSDPAPPRRLLPGIPRDLETICLKCLEKEPNHRYESAADLANDLNRFLMGDPIRARPAGLVRRGWIYAKRHPASAGMILGLFLAGMLGLTAFGLQFRETLSALDKARVNEDIANANAKATLVAHEESERQKIDAQIQLGKANWNLYRGLIAQSQLLIDQSKIPTARHLLDEAPDRYRNWEWYFLRQQTSDALWTYSFRESVREDQGLWIFRQALSPDGSRLAVVANNPFGIEGKSTWVENPTTLLVLDVTGGRAIITLPKVFDSHCHLLFWVNDRTVSLVDYYGSIYTLDILENRWILGSPCPKFTRPQNDVFRHTAVNAKGTVVARGGPGGRIDLIDPLGVKPTRSIQVPANSPWPLGLSPDGSMLLLRGSEPNFPHCERIVETATGKTLQCWPDRWVYAAFSPDGKWVYSGSSTNGRSTITIWDTATWKPAWNRLCSWYQQGHATFSSDSKRFVVRGVGDHHEMYGFDSATGENFTTFRGHESAVGQIDFSPDGRWIASTSDDNSVRIWDAQLGTPLHRFRGHEQCSRTASFTRDGRSVITGGCDEKIISWDLTRNTSAGGMMPPPKSGGYGTEVGALGFTPEGRVVALSTRCGLTELDAETSNPVRRIQMQGLTRRDAKDIADYQFSADGNLLAGRAADGRSAALWNPATGELRKEYPTGFDRLWCVAISPDGRSIAASGSNKGPTGKPLFRAFVWDATSGEVLLEQSCEDRVSSLAFSKDNRLALGFLRPASNPGPAILLFDASCKLVREIAPKPTKDQDMGLHAYVNNLLFSPDGRTLAASCLECSQILLFDSETGAERMQLPFDNMVTSLDFSPDGQRLAAIGYTDHVSLFSTATGVNVITIVGATGRENDWAFPAKVKFSRDGRTLAATHWNGDISIWHVDTLKPAEIDPARVRAVAEKSAFRFHLQAARTALDRSDATTFDFQAGHLTRLAPPTDALRDDWLHLRTRSTARILIPAMARNFLRG